MASILAVYWQLVSEDDKGWEGRSESETTAAQVQTLQSRHVTNILHKKRITNTEWLCHQFDGTVENAISACRVMANEKHIKRHDRLCTL
jgi:hypothetical protein